MQIRIVDLFLFDDTEQKRRHLSRVNDQSFGRLGSSTATRPVWLKIFVRAPDKHHNISLMWPYSV